jgi:hypothetical protein
MGLLDFLNTEDAKLGMGLLAAAGPSTQPMNAFQRIQMAQQGITQDRANALKLGLLQSQVDENKAQTEFRNAQLAQAQQKQAMGQRIIGQLFPALGEAQPQIQYPSGSAAPASSGVSGSGGGLGKWSPEQVAAAKLAGYDFADIWKEARPSVQVSNGYAYDPKATQPGYLPSLQTTPDGKSVQTQIGRDGQPILSAPRGALDVFQQYQGAAAGFKPMKVYNPDTGREEFTTEGAVVNRAAPARPGYGTEAGLREVAKGDMGADPRALSREIAATEADLAKVPDPTSRAALQGHLADLKRQQQSLGNYAAGPSMRETVDQKAAEARAVDTSKADVVRDTDRIKNVKTANQFLGITNQVKSVFDMGPTESGLGSAFDATAALVGKSTKGAEAAQRLKALGGWLVANVPRMEGPQSNFDVANYQVMAADVANDKLPLARRKAALDSIETMMKAVAGQQQGGATGEFDAPKPSGKVLDTLPTPNASNKGQRIRDTTTGKILVSNGMQWKEQ